MHTIIIAYGIIVYMRHNAKKVGDVWILNPPEGVKEYVCNCGKPGNPVVSQYNILEISDEQTKGTTVLKNRYSIIDILAGQDEPLRLMEVGTAAGDYAQLMVDNIKIEKMILIDKFDNEDMMPDGSGRYSKDKNYQFIVDRFKDNPAVEVIKSLSNEALPKFIPMQEKDKFDFIYLDSDHSFHNVYNELLYASQIVKQFGIIGIDDFSSATDDPIHPYEVMQAVTTFLHNNREWKVRFFTFGTESLQNVYLSRCFSAKFNV
jgi:predicted O-methyltransferase YrrM